MVTTAGGEALSVDAPCLLRPGGTESNVAMHLATLGHAVSWASRLGADPLGEIVLNAIAGTSVDVSRVERMPSAPTGVFFKNPQATGTTVHYYRAGSAASTMDRAFVHGLEAIAPRIVHVTGITPALSESNRDMLEHLLRDRPFGNALLSFDVNYRPALWSDDAGPYLLRLARLADIVFVGLDEAEMLWGTSTVQDVRDRIGTGAWLVVKDSDREAVSFGEGTETHEPSLDIEVVEPVGAGDAFAAGWLSGLLRGLDDRSKLRLGHIVAASALASTSDHGTLPTPGEIHAALGITARQWHARVDPRAPSTAPDDRREQ